MDPPHSIQPGANVEQRDLFDSSIWRGCWRYIATCWEKNSQNVGLLIACVAAVGAVWAGYEARKARQSADEIGRASVKAQQDSVKAQIQSMQLSVRPFIKIGDVSYSTHFMGGLYIRLNLTVVGQTPAFHVVGRSACGMDKSDKDATLLLKTAESSPVKEGVYVGDLLNINDVRFFACAHDPPNDERFKAIPSVTVAGIIVYDDFFKEHHSTTFCFTQEAFDPLKHGIGFFLKDEDKGKLVPCSGFETEVT